MQQLYYSNNWNRKLWEASKIWLMCVFTDECAIYKKKSKQISPQAPNSMENKINLEWIFVRFGYVLA